MYIVLGTKQTERKLGWVADFCPLCRSLRPFQLLRIGLARHINHISLTQGKLMGHVILCVGCDLRLSIDPARFAGVEKDRMDGGEQLAQRTFPRWRAIHADRLRVEEQLKRSPADLLPAQRKMLLMEPFMLMDTLFESHHKTPMSFDKKSGAGCLFSFLSLLALGFYGGHLARVDKQDEFTMATLAVVATIGGIYTLLMLYLGKARKVDRELVPKLARALAPLRPTLAELAEQVELCRDSRRRIGKLITPDRLLDEVQLQGMRPVD